MFQLCGMNTFWRSYIDYGWQYCSVYLKYAKEVVLQCSHHTHKNIGNYMIWWVCLLTWLWWSFHNFYIYETSTYIPWRCIMFVHSTSIKLKKKLAAAYSTLGAYQMSVLHVIFVFHDPYHILGDIASKIIFPLWILFCMFYSAESYFLHFLRILNMNPTFKNFKCIIQYC